MPCRREDEELREGIRDDDDVAERQLSARYALCVQAKQLDSRLHRHLAAHYPRSRPTRVQARDRVLQFRAELRDRALRPAHRLRREGPEHQTEALRAVGLLHHRDDEVLRSHDKKAKDPTLYRAREERLVAGQYYRCSKLHDRRNRVGFFHGVETGEFVAHES